MLLSACGGGNGDGGGSGAKTEISKGPDSPPPSAPPPKHLFLSTAYNGRGSRQSDHGGDPDSPHREPRIEQRDRRRRVRSGTAARFISRTHAGVRDLCCRWVVDRRASLKWLRHGGSAGWISPVAGWSCLMRSGVVRPTGRRSASRSMCGGCAPRSRKTHPRRACSRTYEASATGWRRRSDARVILGQGWCAPRSYGSVNTPRRGCWS